MPDLDPQQRGEHSPSSSNPLLESLQDVSRYVVELEWAFAAERLSKRQALDELEGERLQTSSLRAQVGGFRTAHASDGATSTSLGAASPSLRAQSLLEAALRDEGATYGTGDADNQFTLPENSRSRLFGGGPEQVRRQSRVRQPDYW